MGHLLAGVRLRPEQMFHLEHLILLLAKTASPTLPAAQTAERDMLILRLSLLGWTQEEIGEVAGITRQAIGQLLQENAESGKTAFTSTILSLSSAGHDIATICERTALPELLVRAVILRDKSDEDRLREFLPLWSALSAFAARVLRPSGMLVAYTGALDLPEVITRLTERLTYWWAGARSTSAPLFQVLHSVT